MMMMIITKYENAELSEGPNAHCCITCLIIRKPLALTKEVCRYEDYGHVKGIKIMRKIPFISG